MNAERIICLQQKLGSCAACQALALVLKDPEARKRTCPEGSQPQEGTLKKTESRAMGQPK